MKINYSKKRKNIFESESYDTLMRFISYYNQKKITIDVIKNDTEKKILEVGKGNGFLSEYLKKRLFNVKTFDNDKSVSPDFIGDIKKIKKVVNKKFDLIACFEVLEHIKYSEVDAVLEQFSFITNDYVIISVPQCRLFFTLWADMNVFHNHSFSFNIPVPLKHVYDGEHYWELGKKDYSIRNFRKLLGKYFFLEKEFVHPLDTYHRFFILRKKG